MASAGKIRFTKEEVLRAIRKEIKENFSELSKEELQDKLYTILGIVGVSLDKISDEIPERPDVKPVPTKVLAVKERKEEGEKNMKYLWAILPSAQEVYYKFKDDENTYFIDYSQIDRRPLSDELKQELEKSTVVSNEISFAVKLKKFFKELFCGLQKKLSQKPFVRLIQR
ncbi:MAG: hypothetical protein M0R03_11055 [Novosphingobium sp.]|nr:hypothetical protein [Novosphingobium sp.]